MVSKLRITLVCQGFDSTTLKLQPWRRVYEISKRIASKGISVTILTDGYVKFQGKILDKINIVTLEGLSFAPFIRKEKLKETIISTNPDVVVWYGTPFSAFFLAGLSSLQKPLIWDIETDLYNLKFLCKIPLREILNPINKIYLYFLTAILSKYFIRIVGNSSFIKKIIVPNNHLKKVLLEKGIFSNKIKIIGSAIEKQNENNNQIITTDDLRLKLGYNEDDFLITYFGAPHTLRGPDIAILSMPQIISKLANAKLLVLSRRILGDINDKERYNRIEEQYLKKQITKFNLENHITVISGFLEKERLNQYIQSSDVVVFPFRLVPSEPPVSVFEAMSKRKAIVTTNIGCLSEIMQDNRGLLVEPGSACELANAVLYLANNPKSMVKLSENAMKFASALPDWDTLALQFEEVVKAAVRTQNMGFSN
jgi:glycosyltransferase involved in cell wall biosynthesis